MGNGDFTPAMNKMEDGFYVIGFQGMAGENYGTELGMLVIVNLLRQHDYDSMYGGLRLPGFSSSKYKLSQLEEYIEANEDPLLANMLKSGASFTEVLKPMPNYWPDPQSRNCAALIKITNPFYHCNRFIRYLVAPLILDYAICIHSLMISVTMENRIPK